MSSRPPSIKINVGSYLDAVSALSVFSDRGIPVKWVMFADSYFMTHGGCSTTAISTESYYHFAKEVYLGAFLDFARVLQVDSRRNGWDHQLMLDAPDLRIEDHEDFVDFCRVAMRFGCSAVKVEMIEGRRKNLVLQLREIGMKVIGHLGYMPQKGGRPIFVREGSPEAKQVIDQVEALRQNVVGLTLECVSAGVVRQIRKLAPELELLTIFSGTAEGVTYSVNVRDAVLINELKFFPKSGVVKSALSEDYNEENILISLSALADDIIEGRYPVPRG